MRGAERGWQMRVALARLLLSPAGDAAKEGIAGGFLLLDEPTNHLDASAKEYLRGWLRRYKGTALIVSHDEQLLDRGVDRLVEVRAARLHGYSGNYARFLSERAERRKVAAAAAAKETKRRRSSKPLSRKTARARARRRQRRVARSSSWACARPSKGCSKMPPAAPSTKTTSRARET